MADNSVQEMIVVAVSGPGDGRRYTITSQMKGVRIFKDGPMRGNMVPHGIALLRGTWVDYDLGEFGIQGESSVYLLKPVGSTLVQVMGLLTLGYAGMGGGAVGKAALDHTVALLREAHEVIYEGDAELTKRQTDVHDRIDKFFGAYDSNKQDDADDRVA